MIYCLMCISFVNALSNRVIVKDDTVFHIFYLPNTDMNKFA